MGLKKTEWIFLLFLTIILFLLFFAIKLFPINIKTIKTTDITTVETSDIDVSTWVKLLGFRSSKFQLPPFEESEVYMDIYRKDTNYQLERIGLFKVAQPNQALKKREGFLAFAPIGSHSYQVYWGTDNNALAQTAIDFSSFLSGPEKENMSLTQMWFRSPNLLFENNGDTIETTVFIVTINEDPKIMPGNLSNPDGLLRLINLGHEVIIVFRLRIR